ncbi:MAG TPA: hypothetical protein VGY66_33290, partial [Gemmataceae bacterium]|nr:hypothetical protein [Gemmataceae bacterium]
MNSRVITATANGQARRCHLWLCACLTVPALMGGCARRAGEPISLVLMSPHRDEIREEFDLGFRDWFRERSEARLAAARATLQTCLQHA